MPSNSLNHSWMIVVPREAERTPATTSTMDRWLLYREALLLYLLEAFKEIERDYLKNKNSKTKSNKTKIKMMRKYIGSNDNNIMYNNSKKSKAMKIIVMYRKKKKQKKNASKKKEQQQ
jgi:hypothetical protein